MSTSALLIEDYADLPCVENIDDMPFDEDEREEIAYAIAHNYMQQIIEDGNYHANPHAGNILISESQKSSGSIFG